MIKKIFFASHNKDKLREAQQILGITVEPADFEVDEIQSLDPIEVATKKAQAYFQKLKKPIFVEDVSLVIDGLNGLPGPYIDAFMKTLGNAGIVRILKGVRDRKAVAQATVVYIPKKGKEKVFIGRAKGVIAEKPRGRGFGWDPIFIPMNKALVISTGERKTFGEMTLDEKNRYSMRAKALKKFKRWLENNL